MFRYLRNASVTVGIAGLLTGIAIAPPAQSATVPVSQVAAYTEQAPVEIDPADAINQDLVSYEAVVVAAPVAARAANPYSTRVAVFEIPDGCNAGPGGKAARTYICGERSFDFSPAAYFDNGTPKTVSTSFNGSRITVNATSVPYTYGDLTFSMFAAETVPDGVEPDEAVSSFLEMAKEDEPFATDAELAAEDQELSDGYEDGGDAVASSEAEAQVSAGSRPSKVGIPSSYRYCSSWDRLVAKKKGCTPSSLHDYCTWSPNRPQFHYGSHTGQVDFRGPCARHDMGISKIIKQGGTLTTKRNKRAGADKTFRSRMYQNCANAYYSNNSISKGLKGSCRGTASLYYSAVKKTTNKWKGK